MPPPKHLTHTSPTPAQGTPRTLVEETVELPSPLLTSGLETASERAPYVMVIRGPALGRVVKMDGSETLIGRSAEADLAILDAGVSRRHARVRRLDWECWHIEDLGSRNGTWVNGVRAQGHLLSTGDRIQLGSLTILQFSLQDSLEERFQQRLYEASIRDGLTGAFNRHFFTEHLRTEYAWAVRHGEPLSLVLFDLDQFKAINDTYGHLLGDHALRELVGLVRDQLRAEDALSRYGGDEFCVALRGTTYEEARVVADRIRRVVAGHGFGQDERRFGVTVSIGIATVPGDELEGGPEALIHAADVDLYGQKAGHSPIHRD
jgi:two-component system, cell cycle response regulator